MTPRDAAPLSGRSARELLRRRIDTQWIAGPRDTPVAPAAPARQSDPDPREVVSRLLALQAQDFGQAVWALGIRSPGATRDTVFAALDDGSVVRSWPMRGTLHFTTPDDLRWMLSVTASRTVSGVAARQRQLDIDDALVARAGTIAEAELRGGGSFSREEFFALLEADGITTGGQRGQHLIWRLAHRGLLCWGPTRASQQAMVLLDEWAPATREVGREEALGEFVLRYVAGHGPTTLADFCWWSKVTVADATRGLQRVRDQLDEVQIGGQALLVALGAPAVPSRASGGRMLLPGFDEFLLGYRSRRPALAEADVERVVPGSNGIFLPMAVSGGHVVGTWRRAVRSTSVSVEVDLFDPDAAGRSPDFAPAATAYARFTGLPLKA
ncbi:MAG: winged helix DNA-binding domain-containing protein [Herbiconiux sp.]|nr:winged helix DNA-binding domain-containing protein [Herbiconiux sp.]